MEFSTWLLFSVVALLAIISPGPAILLAISNSLTHGTRSVYLSALGNEIGILIVSLSAVLGLVHQSVQSVSLSVVVMLQLKAQCEGNGSVLVKHCNAEMEYHSGARRVGL